MKHTHLQAKEVHKQANPSYTYTKITFTSLLQSNEIGLESNRMNSADAPALQVTRRISIPYGFQTPLPIMNSGYDVVASGHGGCTAGEQATVAITLTQAISGAVATGEDVHTCTGQLHIWSSVVTADTSPVFIDGAAEACGLATTRDEYGELTDSYQWCRDVTLVSLGQKVYLSINLKE